MAACGFEDVGSDRGQSVSINQYNRLGATYGLYAANFIMRGAWRNDSTARPHVESAKCPTGGAARGHFPQKTRSILRD